MIHGVFGKLGSGKGLLVVDIIVKELTDGFRDVVTNVPLRMMPWVNGQGLPQLGLRAYLLEKLYPLGEDEIDEILKRVHVIEDIDQGYDLFLWRRDGDTGEWFKLEITKTDEKGRPDRFNAQQIKDRHCNPILCVTDEAWQFYPNNGGYARAPVLAFYSRQQRKLRDEWFIVTQHPDDCDSVLWKIAQDFWQCRNHGMERLGIFRQPSMFRVRVYLTNPAKGGAIMSHEFYKRLDKKLAQCYDTTAGVGISGGHKGDSNQKKSGLHPAFLIGGIILFTAGLAGFPYLLQKAVHPFIQKTIGAHPVTNSVPALKHTALQTPVSSTQFPIYAPPPVDVPSNPPPVGFIILNGKPKVFLADGTMADEDTIEMIKADAVKMSGKWYKLKAPKNDSAPSYSEPVQSSTWPVSQDAPVNQAMIAPTIHANTPSPSPVLNGYSQMSGGMRSYNFR